MKKSITMYSSDSEFKDHTSTEKSYMMESLQKKTDYSTTRYVTTQKPQAKISNQQGSPGRKTVYSRNKNQKATVNNDLQGLITIQNKTLKMKKSVAKINLSNSRSSNRGSVPKIKNWQANTC